MHRLHIVIFIIFIQINKILCTSSFGNVFPIPLSITNDDPNFKSCPKESGTYTHTANCSLFHMCTFGIHTIYSCIDGFFYNPTSGNCEYFPADNETKCEQIVQHMLNTDLFPLAEPVKNYDYYHRRKSSESKCTQGGIYPDTLDCSIFHYCHQNKEHEVLKCPNGLHFDPKIFMCSEPELVDCQYEPPTESTPIDDEDDSTSTIQSDSICHGHAAGSYLPVPNKSDEYIMCQDDGKSVLMKCKSGFKYNSLTNKCEMKPCTMDGTLCKNNGHCVDDLTNTKGFRCVCSIEYEGEYCENFVNLIEATTKITKVSTSTEDLLNFANQLFDNQQELTTNKNVDINTSEKPEINIEQNVQDKISSNESSSTKSSPLTRIIHQLYNNSDESDDVDEVMKIIFIIILTFIACILFGSIIFGIVICSRVFLSSKVETVGPWKILTEESKA